jgi:hypothetical protein
MAALAAIAGSLITRFAWFSAGRASAEGPVVALEKPVAGKSAEKARQ